MIAALEKLPAEVPPSSFSASVLKRAQDETDLLQAPKDYLPLIGKLLFTCFVLLLGVFAVLFVMNFQAISFRLPGQWGLLYRFTLFLLLMTLGASLLSSSSSKVFFYK